MNISLSDYQDWVESVSSDRVNELGLIYAGLGLAGETGETVERVKKIVRDREGVYTPEDREYLRLELGDIVWYVAKFCNELDLDLTDVLLANMDKINDRRVNGKK
jgi:NTP pyrophosphatase (non-canonical NTP hydrolase)